MNNKTFKNIHFCSYTALTFCAVWAFLMVVHFIQIFKGSMEIDWQQHTIFRIGFVVIFIFSCFASIWMCGTFAVNIIRGLRDNMVFPKSNVKLLYWLALTFFVYLLCWSNESILFNDEFAFKLSHSNILIPFFLLFFAFMYKVAADAVEENNLTI